MIFSIFQLFRANSDSRLGIDSVHYERSLSMQNVEESSGVNGENRGRIRCDEKEWEEREMCENSKIVIENEYWSWGTELTDTFDGVRMKCTKESIVYGGAAGVQCKH